ncbi:hypothetical protein FSARC_11795 [Fusarium sarcochroum]|uniref:NACHT domain-containing protein n=1 Tax=Fusarium sarcochroum TaxID=1208366 RepID=A0A8H4TDI5_9HYPO|nr:hypothetical protein FSARC_11795 [Fusarium sarcochroum]
MSQVNNYTVGWISAITPELVAARAFLDESHAPLKAAAQGDDNTYCLGRMGEHNVVIACLPRSEYGTTSAATVAKDMMRTFPNIRIGLMVGIGGGAPSDDHDVRLGDIVVSARSGSRGGVFQYDYGKAIQNQPFSSTGVLNQPPQLLLTAAAQLEVDHVMDGHNFNNAIEAILVNRPNLRGLYSRPTPESDRLYRPDVVHPNSPKKCVDVCSSDPDHLVSRAPRNEFENNPAIHYGLIASANTLMKNALLRDKLAADEEVLCFEMEAAGLMNHYPCLVIRGICDYSDSHKNKAWQGFAAIAAAAYAKDLLAKIPPSQVEAEKPIGQALDSIQSSVNEAIYMLSAMKTDQLTLFSTIKLDEHARKVKDWLDPADYSTSCRVAQDKQLRGTGLWIFDSPFFKEWQTMARQHLWIHGLSGCGKTTLMSNMFKQIQRTQGKITLGFFFYFSDKNKQTLHSLLRSLAFQLFLSGQNAEKQVDELFEDCRYGREEPSTKALSKCIASIAKDIGDLVIIIDALDECDPEQEQRQVLSWIKEFSKTNTQLLVSSRPEDIFKEIIPGTFGKDNCIALDMTAIDADIYAFVENELQRPDGHFVNTRFTEDVLQEVHDQVGRGSNGSFRWAECQMRDLASCYTSNDLRKALKILPKDLKSTYERSMDKIHHLQKCSATRLLQFLVYAKRPLRLSEAIEVIATEMEGTAPRFHTSNRLPIPTDILRYCPSLVEITSVARDEGSIQELHLAHFSVKEFLLDRDECAQPVSDINITQTCLAYLRDIQGSSVQTKIDFPMAAYIADVWIQYAGPAEVSKDVVNQIVRFVKNQTTFQRWVLLRYADHNLEAMSGPVHASVLYEVCLGGLAETAKVLINEGADVNVRGEEYDCPLQAASRGGHRDTVRLLLDHGADVNAQGGAEGNAIQAACAAGHYYVVELLIERGADVNPENGITITQKGSIRIPNGRFNNPLDAAAAGGHFEVVQLLLDKGADVDARSTWNYFSEKAKANGIRLASDILPYMLDHEVRIIVAGGSTNILYSASYKERVKYVKDRMVNHVTSISGGDYKTPLAAAKGQDHEEVVELLLRYGAQSL